MLAMVGFSVPQGLEQNPMFYLSIRRYLFNQPQLDAFHEWVFDRYKGRGSVPTPIESA